MPLRIVNLTRRQILADRAEIANTNAKRLRGLLDKTWLHSREGLWIVPCQSIHTVGMKFPIDVLFVDYSGHVVQISSVPQGADGIKNSQAYSVVELAAGRAAVTQTEIGDQLVFQRA
jgi:uncharacterized protein